VPTPRLLNDLRQRPRACGMGLAREVDGLRRSFDCAIGEALRRWRVRQPRRRAPRPVQRRSGQPRPAGEQAGTSCGGRLPRGGRLALGSDFPVEAVNPFFGIYAAVTRQDQKGWPAGGWYPDQKLTLAEAIRGFTSDAAYAAFEEGSRGTIETGKLADLTIVEGNLYSMPQSELFKVRVRYTVVGG